MIDLIISNPVTFWFLLCVVFALVELNAPGVFIIFFSMGACATGLVCSFFGINFGAQMIIFLVSSSVFLLAFRNYFKKIFQKYSKKSEEIEDEFIGKEAVVEKVISPGKKGRVSFKGSSWDAISESYIGVGENVIIIKRESIVLQVIKEN